MHKPIATWKFLITVLGSVVVVLLGTIIYVNVAIERNDSQSAQRQCDDIVAELQYYAENPPGNDPNRVARRDYYANRYQELCEKPAGS